MKYFKIFKHVIEVINILGSHFLKICRSYPHFVPSWWNSKPRYLLSQTKRRPTSYLFQILPPTNTNSIRVDITPKIAGQ